MTFHADVRTRSDVQKGSNTSIISRLAVRAGKFASIQPTGYPKSMQLSVMTVDMNNVRKNSVA